MTHVHCPECGFQNLEAARYCEKCGAPLIPEEGGDQTLSSLLPAYPLDRERLTIGRSPEADIFLDDVTVSRRHARLLRQGKGFAIKDEGSLNGTFVNRRRIESHSAFKIQIQPRSAVYRCCAANHLTPVRPRRFLQ